ncbi:catalase [Bradyrhizobium sp. Arg237L]|uniref:catalase n=1 Tax=Bradyrhizobium sp. Arg237L TaxID=3003352 RepID=UPI00249DFF52|nr:catalase [Bradyrhizobium sp. Arg237L]MDI4232384.1 catalase [Bradyrhizobium sp. Arg237L]
MNRDTIQQWLRGRRSGAVSFAQAQREDLIVLSFRVFRDFQRFWQMARGSAQSASAPARSSEAMPARYEELANALELQDRPMPLTKFERAVPGEATLIANMARIAANLVVKNYCEMKASDRSACAMRDQHAKAHGCVDAEFIVRDDLPAEFSTPLFRPGARYRTIVRLSNGQGQPQSDRKPDGRGMSIKLYDVAGETILRGLEPGRTPAGEHDFLLSSFPVFFCKDVVDYSELMEAVAAPSGTWREKGRRALKWIVFAVRNPRQFATFLRTAIVRINNPLTASYHSMSPYLLGEQHVVRYLVSPVPARNDVPSWWSFFFRSRPDNFLQEAMLRDLSPTPPGDDIVFDFAVRVRHSAKPEEVENALLQWTRPQDRTVSIGEIRIPRQNFLTPDRVFDGERMMFSPWNCLQQHRPLGSINRMRLAVYLASLQVRRKLNMVGP